MAHPRIVELLNEIEACEGMRLYWKSKMWDHTFYTFSANALELRERLKRYEDPNQALIRTIENRSPANAQFLADVIRCLHNFLASAKSLVDHSRNLMEDVYADHPLLTEYQERVRREMGSSGLVQFVHDLRNYILHKGIPIIQESLTIRPGEKPVFSVALDLSRMRDWSKWSHGAREYIDSLPDHVRLAEVVEPYLEQIVFFHQWLTNRRLEVDRPAMENLRELQRQLRQICTESQ